MAEFSPLLQYPLFGSEIPCPHCQRVIPALVLTDAYICSRHGAFEVESNSQGLIHLQSGRCWQRWENKWYRQHSHAESLRAEIQDNLDLMYRQGWQITKIAIAQRYQELLSPYLDSRAQLFGIDLEFKATEERWQVINFDLSKQPGIPSAYFIFNPQAN
jgi:uncharacterized protein (TIGR02652 family)